MKSTFDKRDLSLFHPTKGAYGPQGSKGQTRKGGIMKKAKILVVDDNVAYCDELKQKLTETDLFTVTAVYDGLSAIRACEKDHDDAMVLDMVMPSFDGLDVLNTLSDKKIAVNTIAVNAARKAANDPDIETGEALALFCDMMNETVVSHGSCRSILMPSPASMARSMTALSKCFFISALTRS